MNYVALLRLPVFNGGLSELEETQRVLSAKKTISKVIPSRASCGTIYGLASVTCSTLAIAQMQVHVGTFHLFCF
jgi:hypothetical protein